MILILATLWSVARAEYRYVTAPDVHLTTGHVDLKFTRDRRIFDLRLQKAKFRQSPPYERRSVLWLSDSNLYLRTDGRIEYVTSLRVRAAGEAVEVTPGQIYLVTNRHGRTSVRLEGSVLARLRALEKTARRAGSSLVVTLGGMHAANFGEFEVSGAEARRLFSAVGPGWFTRPRLCASYLGRSAG